MALARHPRRSHRAAGPSAWPDRGEDEGRAETIVVVALRVAALLLVGYLGTIM